MSGIDFFISRQQKLKWNSELWLLFGYAALSLVSTLVSEYSAYSWSGAYEQFEPIWCTLIYVVINVYINNLVQEQKQIKVILTALAIGTLVLSVIGALQAVGIDIVAGPVGQFFMLPSDAQGAQLQGAAFRGLTYMTLYNPNYIGTYVSLLLPLFISLFISTKERKYQILYALNCVFLFISGLGCKSESARWGMTLVLLLMLVAWIKRIPKLSGRIWFVSIISTAINATNLFYMSGMTALYSDTPTCESATENGLGEDVGEISDTSYIPISKNLKSIETLDDKLRVGYGDDFLTFLVHSGMINLFMTYLT